MVNILWQNIIVIKCNRYSIGLKRNRRDMITLSTHKRNEDIVSFLTDVFLYCLAGKKKRNQKKKVSHELQKIMVRETNRKMRM